MDFLFDDEKKEKLFEVSADDVKQGVRLKRFRTIKDLIAKEGQLFFQVVAEDAEGNLLLSKKPVYMKNVDSFSIEKKESNKFKFLFPLSVALNFLAVLAALFTGFNSFFIGILFFNFLLVALIFIAGENFWLWVMYAVFKRKNWHYKIKSLINGRDTLHFSRMKETEKFLYVDNAGQKRESETTTRSTRLFSNLGARYTIYREGFPDSIDIHEQYPVSKINRDINQTIVSAKTAGALWVIDKYLGLIGKDKKDLLFYLLIGVVALLAMVSAYYGFLNHQTLADGIGALKDAISTLNVPQNIPPVQPA